MNEDLKERLRHFKIDLLRLLQLLCVIDSVALDLEEISFSTNTAETDLRGVISALRRTKVEGKPLIQIAGRDDKGRYRWRINEGVVKKEELAKFLEEEILGKESIKKMKNPYRDKQNPYNAKEKPYKDKKLPYISK